MKTVTVSLRMMLAVSVVCLSAAAQTPAALPDAPSAAVHELPPAEPTGPTAVIDTTMGRISCKLFDKEAPVTVANFVGLATGAKPWTDPVTAKKMTNTPFYDGVVFHRVIPNFMVQTGDRLGNGTGDPGFYFEDEFSPALRFDVPGRLAMANSGPNSNGSQFFVTEVPVPQLNGKHTIFGQCDMHSVLVIASIARVQRNRDDKPVDDVVMTKVTIVPAGQPLPPEPAQLAPGVLNAPGVIAPGARNVIPAGASPISAPPGGNTRPPQ